MPGSGIDDHRCTVLQRSRMLQIQPCERRQLDDVSLRYERASREAFESERGDVDFGFLVEQQLCQQQRRRRCLHEAMPAEAGGAPETLDLGDGTKDRLVVRGGLVEAGPRRLYARARVRSFGVAGAFDGKDNR